jgi:hypothetical protein
MTLTNDITPSELLSTPVVPARNLPPMPSVDAKAVLIQDLPLDLLDQVGGGSGLTLII